MALRFRKRVRIAPGISINITSKGITSATIGPRGASVNIGKRGTYLNAGIPGTGIYAREKISGPKKNSPPKTKAIAPNVQQTPNLYQAAQAPKKSSAVTWMIILVVIAVILIAAQ